MYLQSAGKKHSTYLLFSAHWRISLFFTYDKKDVEENEELGRGVKSKTRNRRDCRPLLTAAFFILPLLVKESHHQRSLDTCYLLSIERKFFATCIQLTKSFAHTSLNWNVIRMFTRRSFQKRTIVIFWRFGRKRRKKRHRNTRISNHEHTNLLSAESHVTSLQKKGLHRTQSNEGLA